jgi:hypothetical protein
MPRKRRRLVPVVVWAGLHRHQRLRQQERWQAPPPLVACLRRCGSTGSSKP